NVADVAPIIVRPEQGQEPIRSRAAGFFPASHPQLPNPTRSCGLPRSVAESHAQLPLPTLSCGFPRSVAESHAQLPNPTLICRFLRSFFFPVATLPLKPLGDQPVGIADGRLPICDRKQSQWPIANCKSQIPSAASRGVIACHAPGSVKPQAVKELAALVRDDLTA